jgi:hypothetical protein
LFKVGGDIITEPSESIHIGKTRGGSEYEVVGLNFGFTKGGNDSFREDFWAKHSGVDNNLIP